MNTERYAELHTPAQVKEKIEQTISRLASQPVTLGQVWITIKDPEQLRQDAEVVGSKLAQGVNLPLAGLTVAVKDNIDVAGLPTTCAAPWSSHVPEENATCVQRLIDAGAIIVGKTNMDQFATGLVGTRSPYGVVRCVHDTNLISGGSSSGSGVATAYGEVDIALGTDTAGSGRVPAAFNRIYGIKPTVGMIPVTGVTPACPSFDTVSVFCRDIILGYKVLSIISGEDGRDSRARVLPEDMKMSVQSKPVVLAPLKENIDGMDERWESLFFKEMERFESEGVTVQRVDVTVLLEAAKLLYGGSLVAERYASIGQLFADKFDENAGEDPSVRSIVMNAKTLTADLYVKDTQKLLDARMISKKIFDNADALVLPTTTRHPTIDQVQADPINVNSDLGRFTNFVNLLDLSALAVPSKIDPDLGITLIAPAFHDYALASVADRLGLVDASNMPVPDYGVELFVVGEHMRGLSLNHQLQDLGARFEREAFTSDDYRLVDLPTTPAKPTIVRGAEGKGGKIAGEIWRLSPVALAEFLNSLPHPMSLGPVDLEDGRIIIGFGVDSAVYKAKDITSYSSWRAYLAENK